MNSDLIPLKVMITRTEKAKDESDAVYFYELLLFGELITKLVVSALVAGIKDDKDRNRYRQLHRLVRADGIGEWSSVLDELIGGVSSQFLATTIINNEQKDLQGKLGNDSWQYQCITSLNQVFETLNLPKTTISNRVQGRIWFNMFAQLRNSTKGHGAPLPANCGEACEFLEISIRTFIDNFYLFKREWVYLRQNLSGKYKVTPLNGLSPNFDELKTIKQNQSIYEEGVYIFFDARTHINLIASNSHADDFFLPNGNFKEKNFEMLSYISDGRTEGDSNKYLIPANELPNSETQGLISLEVQGNCFGNIPILASDYIVRTELEEKLQIILNEKDRYPIVTLLGRGGIGKTTLALSVLHQITDLNRFDIILWFSARDIDLKLEGPKAVKNSILTELDIAEEFIKLLNISLTKKSEKIEYLSKQMTKSDNGNILFVFDNFETVQNPTELFNWIDTFIRNPNKVLITSRISKSFKADYPIEIHGMNEDECKDLIKATAEKLKIERLIDINLVESIIHESQGHPYVIKILLGEIAKSNKKVSKIDRIIASQDDILIALFRRTYNTLTQSGKRVFLTLCSWRSIIPQVALEAVLLRDANEERINVDDAIDELKRSSFIDIISTDNESHSFISVPLAAFLFGKSELEVSPMKIAILSDRELLQEFGVTQQTDLSFGIKPRIERKFRTVANKITSKEDLKNHIPMLEYLSRKFPFAWNYLSTIYLEYGDYERACECLREYLKFTLNIAERKATLLKLSEYYKISKNYLGEVNTLTDLCLLPNSSFAEVSDVANVITTYIANDKLNIEIDIKESIVKKIIDVISRKANNSITATDYSRIAWLYIHLKEFDKARTAIDKGLQIDMLNIYCFNLSKKFPAY